MTRGSRWRAAAIAAAAAALALALTACTPSQTVGSLPTHGVTETVPAPSGGTIDQQIPSPSPVATVEAAIGKPAKVDGGVSVKLTSVTATKVKAETPGEVSGSAVVVTVVVTNKGTSTASVDSAYLQLVASDGTLGIGTTAGGGKPLHGTVAPGASATGSYVFMLSAPRGREVTITVSHAAGAPVAQFEGTIS
jgi:poly(3-hydroxybutyrate) depolymerase